MPPGRKLFSFLLTSWFVPSLYLLPSCALFPCQFVNALQKVITIVAQLLKLCFNGKMG